MGQPSLLLLLILLYHKKNELSRGACDCGKGLARSAVVDALGDSLDLGDGSVFPKIQNHRNQQIRRPADDLAQVDSVHSQDGHQRIGQNGANGASQKTDVKDRVDRPQASQIGMEHVTRSFQATYYMTPKQYFDRRVMNIALEELKNGARVYEVAEALNYSSAYAFSKAFKKKTGMSPEKYVKTYLKTE